MKEEICFVAGDAPEVRPFTVIAFGVSYCDGTYRITRRNSPVHVFESVVAGRGSLTVNGRKYEPAAGDVYMVPAGSTHVYASSAEDPWIKLWFNVRGPLVRTLVTAYGLSEVHHVPDCHLEEVFRRGQDRAKQDLSRAHDIVAVTVHEILCALGETLRARAEIHQPKATRRLREQIEKRIFGRMDLATMSELCGKSPSQTIRLFRREWGQTPYQYLLGRKIEAAEVMLADTVKPVKEIAADLGFQDEFYFSSLFKRKTGQSPSARRARVRR